MLKSEKKRYFSNLDLSNYTDNKKFWKTVKPLLSGGNGTQKITLVENDEVIGDDKKIAETFNDYFVKAASTS